MLTAVASTLHEWLRPSNGYRNNSTINTFLGDGLTHKSRHTTCCVISMQTPQCVCHKMSRILLIQISICSSIPHPAPSILPLYPSLPASPFILPEGPVGLGTKMPACLPTFPLARRCQLGAWLPCLPPYSLVYHTHTHTHTHTLLVHSLQPDRCHHVC